LHNGVKNLAKTSNLSCCDEKHHKNPNCAYRLCYNPGMPPRKTPESQRQVQLWARAFEQRRKQTNVALKNLGLKPYDMTRWRNEGRRPQNQRIEALIHRCLAQHVWHGEAEVIDWLALLDISGHDTLRMLYAGQEGAQADKDIQAKIDGVISTNRWWRSPRH